jgi:hypothetical protein
MQIDGKDGLWQATVIIFRKLSSNIRLTNRLDFYHSKFGNSFFSIYLKTTAYFLMSEEKDIF